MIVIKTVAITIVSILYICANIFFIDSLLNLWPSSLLPPNFILPRQVIHNYFERKNIVEQKISDIRSLSYEETKNMKVERLSLDKSRDYEIIKKGIIKSSELSYVDMYLYIYERDQVLPSEVIKFQKLENGQLIILDN